MYFKHRYCFRVLSILNFLFIKARSGVLRAGVCAEHAAVVPPWEWAALCLSPRSSRVALPSAHAALLTDGEV